MTLVLLIANGDVDPATARRLLAASFDRVVAVDGGANHCRALGLRPDLVVGDLDSLSRDTLEHFTRAGVPLERHPVQKDETDLELALAGATQDGTARIVLAGALGGRFDMTLANVLLLTLPQVDASRLELWDRDQTLRVLRPPGGEFQGRPGDTLSLLPLRGDAEGVRTEGLAYPLRDETLPFGRTRGVSNVFTGASARVLLSAGTLLAIQAPEEGWSAPLEGR